MRLVLCITRGGEGGIRAQDEAIALAKAQDGCLVFLYVLDTSFLNKIVLYGNRRLAVEELVKLGEFLLAMAVERAKAEGVKAKAFVQSGVQREILPTIVREMEATTIVLGGQEGETCIVEEAKLEKFLESSS
jgi:nucleotide-binding universal stress UspA family protein